MNAIDVPLVLAALRRQRDALNRAANQLLASGNWRDARFPTHDAERLSEAELLVADHARLREACDAHAVNTARLNRFRRSNLLKRLWVAWTGELP